MITLKDYSDLSKKENKVIILLIDKGLCCHTLIASKDFKKVLQINSSFIIEYMAKSINRKRKRLKKKRK